MSDQPQCTETRIHRGGDGKVAIVDFGKVSSGYGVNISRTYAVPEDWTDEQVATFEDEQLRLLKPRIDAILDDEFAERWAQHVWEDDQ